LFTSISEEAGDATKNWQSVFFAEEDKHVTQLSREEEEEITREWEIVARALESMGWCFSEEGWMK